MAPIAHRVSLALLVAALLPASAALAATLNLVFDKPSYLPGEAVTLTLIGDSQGGVDNTLFAAIVKPDPSVLSDLALQRFAPPSSDGVPWIQGATTAPVCGPARSECWLIDMIHASSTGQSLPVGGDPALEPFTYAVLTGTAGLPGSYPIAWVTVPTRRVDFFGLTSAPTSTLITSPSTSMLVIVPEPGTAALLAAGLACIGLRLRRAARA
jgi:hypothetical protein